MTDLALLADNTLAVAEALEAAYDEGDQGAIINVLVANAAAFEEIANGAGNPETEAIKDAGLREFYECWKPIRDGRQVTTLEPKKGPLDLAQTWMRVQTDDHGARLSGIMSIARQIAKLWMAITPVIVEATTPQEFQIGTMMGPASCGEGDDEKMVYQTVALEDLTSSQMAMLGIKERPLDFTAAQDARLQGLVYALVQAVKAAEENDD